MQDSELDPFAPVPAGKYAMISAAGRVMSVTHAQDPNILRSMPGVADVVDVHDAPAYYGPDWWYIDGQFYPPGDTRPVSS